MRCSQHDVWVLQLPSAHVLDQRLRDQESGGKHQIVSERVDDCASARARVCICHLLISESNQGVSIRGTRRAHDCMGMHVAWDIVVNASSFASTGTTDVVDFYHFLAVHLANKLRQLNIATGSLSPSSCSSPAVLRTTFGGTPSSPVIGFECQRAYRTLVFTCRL